MKREREGCGCMLLVAFVAFLIFGTLLWFWPWMIVFVLFVAMAFRVRTYPMEKNDNV